MIGAIRRHAVTLNWHVHELHMAHFNTEDLDSESIPRFSFNAADFCVFDNKAAKFPNL